MPWRAKALSMWSKKPTPVAMSALPVPSSSSSTEMSVSDVEREMVAVLVMLPPDRSSRGPG